MRSRTLAKTVSLAALSTLCGVIGFAACSAGSNDPVAGGGAGGGSGAAGSDGSDGLGGEAGDSSSPFVPPDQDDELNDDNKCAGQYFDGHLPPLDVYILLDATGSMNGDDDSPEVWIPVVNAIKGLVSDEMTKGIAVGMTYFPLPPPPGTDVPGSCSTNPNKPCPPGKGACVDVIPMPGAGLLMGKVCDNGCTQGAALSVIAEQCGLYGKCAPFPMTPLNKARGYCQGAAFPDVSCNPADYGEPAVPIAELPGNKNAIVDALTKKNANGKATPSQPALEGALRYLKQWAKDRPDHLVHMLFATDGEPNVCTYNSTEEMAEVTGKALKEYPYVPTFVLGLGEKLSSLDKIAAAGGTEKTYIADGATVSKQLVDMFNEIRANGACQFIIPQPEKGQKLDYDRVNVFYTPLTSDDPVAVGYVDDIDHCDSVKGGWYYNDPTKTQPTKILLCPATCDAVQLSDKGVSVQLGCKTVLL
ncbi:MAG: hypothetical protein FWD57_09845 [Polyangiaceae bacterium]|nr:hypothetical protein [Polyangiaceae bacterium]